MVDTTSPVIHLAEEGDFEIGGLHVRPSACEIVRSGNPVRVEPRVMQVLVALCRRRGRTVSRGRLNEECWGGTAVGDDALVRSISQLRKALGGEDGELSVDTVPRVGYRLVVPSNGLPPTRPGGFPLRRVWPIAAATTIALGLAIAFFVAAPEALPPDQKRPILSTPVTSRPGLEQWPAISPSGGQVAYSWRREPGASRDIYVQSVADDSRLRLTHSETDI